MILLALDPGRTIGWAAINLEAPQGSTYRSGQIRQEELWVVLSTLNPFGEELPSKIIYESFKLRHTPRFPDLSPVECIGVIKQWCLLNHVHAVAQSPAQAKHFWTDDRLKQFQVYRRGKPHANDAMRHLMYYIHFTMQRPISKSGAVYVFDDGLEPNEKG